MTPACGVKPLLPKLDFWKESFWGFWVISRNRLAVAVTNRVRIYRILVSFGFGTIDTTPKVPLNYANNEASFDVSTSL